MDVRLKSPWQLRQLPPEPRELDEDGPESSTPLQLRGSGAGVRWSKLRRLGQVLYPTSSPYGKPTCCYCASKYLLIGTYSADLLVVDYDQTVVAELNARAASTMLGPVTSINVSADETHVIAGFGLGWVAVWDLESPPSGKPALVTAIAPLDPNHIPASQSRVVTQESHVHGKPVAHVGFIGGHHRKFLSIDASGIVILHKHHRVLLDHSTRSFKVLGSYEHAVPLLSADSTGSHCALLTESLLVIFAYKDGGVQEVLSVPRARDTDELPKNHACVKFEKVGGMVKVAYSWGTQLKILGMDADSKFEAEKAYVHPVPIEWFDWLDPSMMLLYANDELDFVSLGEPKVVDLEPLPATLNIVNIRVGPEHTIFALGKHEALIGQLANWADRLLGLLNNARPSDAIELALRYYSDEEDLSLIGLPAGSSLRQQAIRKALPDLIMTALRFSIQYDQENLKALLPKAVHASSVAKLGMLEQILELVNQSNEAWVHRLYLDTLVPLVIEGTIRQLPPEVFKELITYEHSNQQIFYMLDLSTLDLDLAFKLCQKYDDLSEVEIYLKNQALNDYLSPLSQPSKLTMGYIALVLTRRIYPTGEQSQNPTEGQKQIYSALFLGKTTELLQSLIDYDERGLLTALNEAFEDSFLNKHSDVNRQIIINTLLSSSVTLRTVYFWIFVARNYPKYRQFIVLPGSVLQNIAFALTKPEAENEAGSDECQLALLSLLSAYIPPDTNKLEGALISAKYSIVLEHIYRRKGQLGVLILLKLRLGEWKIWDILEEFTVSDPRESIQLIHKNLGPILQAGPSDFAKVVTKTSLRESDIWNAIINDKLDVENRQVLQLQFLDSAYDEISVIGGALPGVSVNTPYVSLLAAHEPKPGRLMTVLNTLLTEPDDIQLPLVVDDFLAENHVDALALLLCRRERHSEAMIYVLNHLASTSDDHDEFAKYTDIAISISLEVSKGNREEGARLWQRLLELLTDIDNEHSRHELERVVNALSESGSDSVIQIVSSLIERKPQESSQVTSQIYVGMQRQMEALKAFLAILQRDVYKDLMTVIEGRALGIVISVDGECQVCGRKVVGLGINAEALYSEWENRLRGKPESESEVEETLVAFRCDHLYHLGCLERMAGRNRDSQTRRCILCYPLE